MSRINVKNFRYIEQLLIKISLMKNALNLLVASLIGLSVFAQSPNWIITPNDYNFIFPNSLPIPPFPNQPSDPYDGYDGEYADFSQNGAYDADGNLRFFVVDGNVFDPNGEFILGNTLQTNTSLDACGRSETVIVQDPGDCQKYYIFTASLGTGLHNNEIPSYTTIDLSEPIADTSHIMGYSTGYLELPDNGIISNGSEDIGNCFFAITPLTSSNERYLYVSSSEQIIKYIVSASGLTYDGVVDVFDVSQNQRYVRGEMEVVELPGGGYRLACPLYQLYPAPLPTLPSHYYHSIYYCDLDASGDYVNNSDGLIQYEAFSYEDESPFIHGLEFDPTGSALFIVHELTSENYADAIDVFTFNDEVLYPINDSDADSYQFSQIELAADGYYYVADEDGLGRLAFNPTFDTNGDLTSYTVTFTEDVQTFTNSAASMPNIPTGIATFLLNDQIDGENYNNQFFGSESCCLVYTHYDAESYTAETNGTWTNGASNNPFGVANGTIIIKDELRIPAGKTITIQNMVVKFNPGAKLIIENGSGSTQGGHLILDNTRLTVNDACNEESMWMGVEVWGNPSLVQGSMYNSMQGRLEMKNSSIIEHAYIAVLAAKRVSGNNFSNASNGGFIQAVNSTFRNNQRDAWIPAYASPNNYNNQSYFTNCTFNWTGLLKIPSVHIEEHVRLDRTKGVRFVGCDFLNDIPTGTLGFEAGRGIYAANSEFYVQAHCTSTSLPCTAYDAGTFENLEYGIIALNAGGQSFLVDRNEFTNCRLGITTISARREQITLNTFNVRESNTVQSAGVYLINSTGYTVSENTLLEEDDTSVTHGDGESYGIVIRNSGTDHNEVYKNLFYDLKIGGQSEAVNGTTVNLNSPDPNAVGLQWLCNTFDKDIYEADMTVNGIIDYHQGYEVPTSAVAARQHATRNTFSDQGENSTLEHDLMFDNSSQFIDYVHLADAVQTPDSYTTSKVALSQATAGGNPVYMTTNACPSKLTKKIISQLAPKFQRDSIADVNDSLNGLIDNGSTVDLRNYVATFYDLQHITNDLLTYSPYLSDYVLEEFMDRSPDSTQLTDVLLANSPLSEYIYDIVTHAGYSRGFLTVIRLAQTGISDREILYNQIQYNENTIQELYDFIIQKTALDSADTVDYSDLIDFLEDENTVRSREDLFGIYLMQSDLTNANTYLSNLLGSSQVSADRKDLLQFRYDLENSGVGLTAYLDADSDRVELLETLAAQTADIYTAQDAAVYLMIYNTTMPGDLFLPIVKSLDQSEGNSMQKPTKPAVARIYPNPTAGEVNVEFLGYGKGSVNVEVFDITGKLVYSGKFSDTQKAMIDLSALHKGVYFIKAEMNGVSEVAKVQLH